MKDKKIISLEISTELKEALRLAAYKEDVTISALIRKILEEKLNVNKNKGVSKEWN